jgi:RNA polymerase sigma factor (sigma-70 family)
MPAMKIPDIEPAALRAATDGDLAAIDRLLVELRPGVFNLALRMLGQREDAGDATQEILLKVVTHLAGFRGESRFSTWVHQIARNHLLSAATRARESPEISLEGIEARLQAGLDFRDTLALAAGAAPMLTPEDKLAARQVALGCTQGMLMALDRGQRLAYLLDVVFGLTSEQAAAALGVTPAAYRKRLSRARAALDPFVRRTCGLVNAQARCQCEHQLPALRHVATTQAPVEAKLIPLRRDELLQAEAHFDAIVRLSDAAALFRAHPQYRAPDSMVAAIRAVLRSEGYAGAGEGPLQ